MNLLELVQSRAPLITLSQGKLPTFIQLHFLSSPFFPSHWMQLIQVWLQVLVQDFPHSCIPFTHKE